VTLPIHAVAAAVWRVGCSHQPRPCGEVAAGISHGRVERCARHQPRPCGELAAVVGRGHVERGQPASAAALWRGVLGISRGRVGETAAVISALQVQVAPSWQL